MAVEFNGRTWRLVGTVGFDRTQIRIARQGEEAIVSLSEVKIVRVLPSLAKMFGVTDERLILQPS